MSRYLTYNPEQDWLLPPSICEELGEEHLSLFVHRMVERLDLSAFEANSSEEGRPGYPPQLLLKVWLYGYALGVTSSRRLEQRIREDLGFRLLAGNLKPDHWTLNEFRRRYPVALNNVFTQVVEAARAMGWGGWEKWPWTPRAWRPALRPIVATIWINCGGNEPESVSGSGAGRSGVIRTPARVGKHKFARRGSGTKDWSRFPGKCRSFANPDRSAARAPIRRAGI